MNLEELNDKQKEAVLYNDGPLLIIEKLMGFCLTLFKI